MSAKVINIVQEWKKFGLSGLQSELDEVAAQIATRQDQSEDSRKALVELTRDFRKNTPEDVRKMIAPLLKSFQSEVDSLSTRSKGAESAFLNVYKKLIDMPDITPALEYSQTAQHKLAKLADLQIENSQLRDTLKDYNAELKDVRSQEVTIKQLEEKIRQHETNQESIIEARTKELERDLLREFQEREQTYHDEQLLSTRRLAEAEHKVAQLTSDLELSQSELFEVKAKYEENTHARSDELDMVLVDLERANQRAALAEREVDSLKEQLAATVKRAQLADEADVGSDPQRRSATERQLASKDNEICQLVEDVQRLQSQLSELENQSVCQRAKLEEELSQKSSIIQRLESIIEQQKDYEELKKEFSILKSIEFPGTSQPSTGGADDRSQSEARPLQVLMLEKSKAMQNENTALKVKTAELQGFGLAAGESAFMGGVAGVLGGAVCGARRPPFLPAPPFAAAPFPSASGALASLACQSASAGLLPPPPPPSCGPPEHVASLIGEESWRAPSDAEEAASPDGKSSPAATEPLPSPRPSPSPAEHAASVAAAAAAAYRFEEPDRADRLIPKGDPMETRLQEMLRYNMDKFSNQSLDTLQLARRVRELLSVNNIGQRMFARYILGLSQGTVSELLSKPKPWEKLTEKGRDSYRKMHAWAVDDAAVYLLKAVIPKKAKDSRASLVGRTEEAVADERIAHILTEASQAMKTEPPGSDERPPADAASPSAQSPLPDSRDALQRLRRLGGPGPGPGCPGGPGSEEGTQEKIARLYQEHLAKMMGQRPDMPPGFSLDHYQRLRNPEELRNAMDFYNQELVRHMQHLQQQQAQQQAQHQHQQQQQQQPLPAVSGAGPAAAAGQQERPPAHSGRPESPSEATDDKNSSAFSQVRPPSAEAHKATAVSSPGSQPPTSGGGGGGPGPGPGPGVGPGPLSGLHPAGFFMHSAAAAAAAAASTASDELATAASPLQRMASITNSLMNSAALPPLQPHPQRPMKAVLPPITQQQFDQFSNLNTEEVVRRIKEHLSQYSISQRLFGESVLGLSQGSVSDLLARPKPWHMLTQKGREPFIRMKMFLDDDNAVHKLVASQYKIAPEKLMRTGCYNGGFPKMPLKLPDMPKSLESPLPPAVSLAAGGFPGLPPAALASRLPGMDPLMKFGLRMPTAGQLPMSVYETAAITPELDTQYITTKIKEVLLANNIGQKLFGETVLGLSQGSVSELLSKPKPWHLLSIKGREPFIRMKMWLEDTPRNLDKLQRIKNDRKESSKRRRSQMEAASESNDSSDVYSTMSNSPNAKKSRVLFSDEQKEALKLAFAMDPYPNMTSVEFLCQELSLTHRTITNWFHNHRMRLKQQTGVGGEPAPYLAAGARDGQQLDPLQFRLLLNRRLQELQRERAAAPAGPLPGPMPFAGLPGPLPFPFLDGRLSGEPMSGLDLSMKSDNDFDNQSDDASNLSAGSSPAPAGSPDGEEEEDDGADSGERRQTAPAGRSSRRKPAAPQWVNPQWAAEPRRQPPPPQLINGVCVMQTELEGGEGATEPSQPLVRVEPEGAPEPEPEPEPEREPQPETEQERPAETEPAPEPEPGQEPEQEAELKQEPVDAEADSSGAE